MTGLLLLTLVILGTVIAAPIVGVALLFHPIRRLPLTCLEEPFWKGRVPYQIHELRGVPFLEVHGLPYPGSLYSSGEHRPKIDLTGSWRFRLDPGEQGEEEGWFGPEAEDAEWETMCVPSTFNAAESDRVGYLGWAWYRRRFSLAPEIVTRPGVPRLCFEGLLLRGKVWCNGTLLGEFEGGYTSNYFDLTGLLREENVIAVRCDNRLTPDSLPPRTKRNHNPGWHTYGGLHRGAQIELLPESYAFSLRTETVAEGVIVTLLTYRGSGGTAETAGVTLLSPEGRPLAQRELRPVAQMESPRVVLWQGELEFRESRRWSPDHVEYHRLEVLLEGGGGITDAVSQPFAPRDIEIVEDQLRLNGTPLFLQGICKHEDHPRFGATQPPELIESDLALIKEMGANYVRLAHYPHSREAVEATEAGGLLQSEEIPLYQAGTGFAAWFQEKESLLRFPLRLFGIRQTRRPELLAHARRQLIEMIERDRHYPSLLFWSLGNECYTLGKRAAEPLRALAEVAHRFDPSRPVTYVELTYNRPLLDRRRRGWEAVDLLSLNSYFGWYYGDAADLEGHLAELRRRWPRRPMVLSEFGADAAPGRKEKDGPWRAERVEVPRSYSEEYQAELLAHYVRVARDRRWIAGVSPWVLADFYNIWFPSNPVPNYNLKGVVSKERSPKQGYHRLSGLYSEGDKG